MQSLLRVRDPTDRTKPRSVPRWKGLSSQSPLGRRRRRLCLRRRGTAARARRAARGSRRRDPSCGPGSAAAGAASPAGGRHGAARLRSITAQPGQSRGLRPLTASLPRRPPALSTSGSCSAADTGGLLPAPAAPSPCPSGPAGLPHLAGTTPPSDTALSQRATSGGKPRRARSRRTGRLLRGAAAPAAAGHRGRDGSGSAGQDGTGRLRGGVGGEEVHGEAEVAALGARVDGRALHVQVEGAAARGQRAGQQHQQPQPRHGSARPRAASAGRAQPRSSVLGGAWPRAARPGGKGGGGAARFPQRGGEGITSSRPAPSSLFSPGQGRQQGAAASCGAGGGPCATAGRGRRAAPRPPLPSAGRGRAGPARPRGLRAGAAGRCRVSWARWGGAGRGKNWPCCLPLVRAAESQTVFCWTRRLEGVQRH